MIRFYFLLYLLFSLSCHLIERGIKVRVVNKTEQRIHSVLIYTSEKTDVGDQNHKTIANALENGSEQSHFKITVIRGYQ